MVEIAYVCSPDFTHYLLSSLRSLLISGTSFDKINIYFIDYKPQDLSFHDSRIQVYVRENLDKNYFTINKVYALNSDAETLIFLDTDTIVLRPLNNIIHDEFEFAGRPTSFYEDDTQNKTDWLNYIKEYDINQKSSYFNAGFFIFKKFSHKKIIKRWQDLTNLILKSENPYHGKRFAEQIALSLLVAKEELKVKNLSLNDHSFGWKNELYHNSVVYHTGTSRFESIATKIEIHRKFYFNRYTSFFTDKGGFKGHLFKRYFLFIKHKVFVKLMSLKKSLTSLCMF